MGLHDSMLAFNAKRVAVLGVGVSNAPLIRLLVQAGAVVTACDQNPNADVSALPALGVSVRLGPDYLSDLHLYDVIFRTPGLHPSLLHGVRSDAVVTSEMELFFQVCPCKIIAVTGSDGKTTTATIIAALLRETGWRVHLGGNIGTPLLEHAADMRPDDIVVLELSSFQLLTMKQSPDIAVVLNLAPNHLDVHLSMDEYISAKANIFLHQTAADKVVLNYDNTYTRAFADRAKGSVVFFSRSHRTPQGVWLRGGVIHCAGRHVLPVDEIRLPGAHNVDNFMAVIAAVDGLVPDETIRRFAAAFPGVEHRIEFVRELGGVRFYNDSIASSPSRAIAALRVFDAPIVLIAGGRDKKVAFDTFAAEIVKRVNALVLTGEAAAQIQTAVEQCRGGGSGGPVIVMEPDFQRAVLSAAAHARRWQGSVVLLSPGCTSFDQFKDFAARGACFKEIVNELSENEMNGVD